MQMETRPQSHNGLSLVLDVLTEPTQTFRYLAHSSHVGLALLAYGVSQLPAALEPPWYLDPELAATATTGIGDVIGTTVISYIGLLLSTLLLHGMAWLLGGRNTYSRILQAQAFAGLPLLFTAPFAVLSHVAFLPAIYAAVSFATFVWSLVLSVIGVRETYRFSTGRALAALVLAALIIAMIIFGFMLMLSVALLGMV